MEEKKLTGYPSIDKPWLKYYSEEAVKAAQGSTPIPEKTLYQYALECNQNGMNDVAFSYFGKQITYKDFFANVQKTADALATMGICKGDIVTIMSMQTPETINLVFALNYIGAAANMVYISLSGKELQKIISETNSKALFILEIALDKIKEVGDELEIPVVVLSVKDSMPIPMKFGYTLKTKSVKHDFVSFKDFFRKRIYGTSSLNTDPDSVAVLVETSGTTGHPKAVMLTSRNLCALVFQYKHTSIRFNRGETFLDLLPIFLGFGIGMLAIAICNGINSILWLQPEAKLISQAFWKQKPNHIALGKAHAAQIIADCPDSADLSFVSVFAGGGENVSIEEQNRINSFLLDHGSKSKFIYGYGMTECASSICTLSPAAYRLGSMGIPLPYSVMKIVDVETREELRYGEKGEICIMSPNVMLGFLGNEPNTCEAFEYDKKGNRWLRTDDLGYIDEDGFVYLTGRLKRIYLIKDTDNNVYKLFPQLVEEVIKKHPMVENCGVIAVPDERRYHRPIAFVVLKDGAEESAVIGELKIFVGENLPHHSCPHEFIFLQNLPVTVSGKINYKALEAFCENRK